MSDPLGAFLKIQNNKAAGRGAPSRTVLAGMGGGLAPILWECFTAECDVRPAYE